MLDAFVKETIQAMFISLETLICEYPIYEYFSYTCSGKYPMTNSMCIDGGMLS